MACRNGRSHFYNCPAFIWIPPHQRSPQASIKSKRGREGAVLLVVEHCVLLVVVEQLPINLKSHLTESCTSSQREDHRITFKDRVKRKVSLAS